MNAKHALSLVLVGGVLGLGPVVLGDARVQEKPQPQVKIPDAGVHEIMTMEGKFVRAAYNNEGYVIIGYQLVNRSVGEDWMLLEFGVTVLDNTPDYRLKRDALSLETPDGKTIPPADDQRAPGGEHHRAAEPGEGPARLDQLLSAECDPGVRAHLLPRLDLSRDAG